MAQSVMGDPVPEKKLDDESPKKREGLSPPQSPAQPFLDADAASILSKLSPQNSEAIVPATGSKGETQKCLLAEKKTDDESDSSAPVKSSTVLIEDKDPSSESVQQNMNTSVPNGSTTPSKETESLDIDTSRNSESNVPLFCVTITKGTEASYEEGIETETITLDNYRDEEEIDSDDSSVSSDSSSDCSDSFLFEMRRSIKHTPAPITYNVKPEDNSYGDLPPIEDLDINVEEDEVALIGRVEGIVELEAVIKSKAGLKPLQLNSVLFLSNQKPLGKVCDVYGPVPQPYYSVKFKSKEHLKKVGVEVGNEVYYAPERAEITEYVFPEELQKVKGSDASGKNDNEPSDDNLDYSDDEKEKEARLRRKKLRQARGKDSRRETTNNQQEHLTEPGSNEPNANPFYSINKVYQNRSDPPKWTSTRPTTSSSYNKSPRQQFQGPSNFSQNSYTTQNYVQRYPTPIASNYRTEVSYQPPPSPFQPPHSPFPQQDQSPYQPPPALTRLKFPTPPPIGSIHFPPPSPLSYQQISYRQMGNSQGAMQQQRQQPPIGPPRPISLQQMHMFGQMTPLGPLSPAPHLSYAPPTIASPPPSTAFPPASPNFSYFSHSFPSAPSPGPSVSHQSFYRAPPSPGGMHVMPPMSPLSIQIPNNVRSPPPSVGANGYNYQGNRNLLQQNIGAYNRPLQRY